MKNKSVLFAAVCVLTALSYVPSYQGEFQFDDDVFISESDVIREPSRMFSKGILAAYASGIRPITQLSLIMNYAVGGLHPEGYHAFNLLLHLGVTALVYLVLRRLFRAAREEEASGKDADWLAFAAAGIFAVHPLQTGAVAYIIQRAEVLASLFYLLSLYCLIRFIGSGGRQAWLWWSLGMVCFLVGWGSKEVIVTVPVTFLLATVFFMDNAAVNRAFKGIGPFLFGGLILGIWVITGFRGSDHAGFDIKGLGQPEYVYTQMRVLLTYFRLIFFPVGQNFDYDYPIYREFFRWEVVGSVAFWSVIVLLSVFSLRIKGRWRWHARLMGFGMLWFMVILLPTSSLVPLKDVIYEHRAYLAMLGTVIAALAAADIIVLKTADKYGRRVYTAAVAAAAGVIIVLALLTYMRNMVWETRLSLWQDVVDKSPNKGRGHNNLANSNFLLGKYEEAVSHYKIALALDPDLIFIYYNMSLAYNRLGRKADAEILMMKFNEEFRKSRPADRR